MGFGGRYDSYNNFILYEDGFSGLTPFTALDIVAHEMGHGITKFTADLAYDDGTESQILSEGFSDIWGACVKNYVNINNHVFPLKDIWLDMYETGRIPRSFINPKVSYPPQPNTYLTGAYWVNLIGCIPTSGNDQCGVHINSGVMNYWFYLLSEGGSGTNDLGNSYDVSGIGIDKAARIVYRAETQYRLFIENLISLSKEFI
jgi:Zn-dependent metalloprotease